jgi:hypothetical protein
VIALAQLFGILPVVSIFNNDITKIKFKIISIRTFFSLFWIGSAITFLCLEISRMVKDESINAKSISGFMFFGVGTFTGILFFRLALKWNELLKVFKTTEDCLQSYTLSGYSLQKRIKIASSILLSAAAFEHSMAIFSFIYDRTLQAQMCNWQIHNWFYYFSSLHQSHVYRIFPVTWYTTLWV